MDFGYINNDLVEEEEHDVVEEEEHDNSQQTYTADEQSIHVIHDAPVPIASLSVKELRRRLKEKGLRVAGAKAKEELVQRLLHPEKETPSQIKNGIAHNVLTADYILRVGLIWVGIGEDRQKVRVRCLHNCVIPPTLPLLVVSRNFIVGFLNNSVN